MATRGFQKVIFRKGDEDFTYYSSTQDNLQADDYGQKARIKEGLVKRQSHLQVLTLQLSPLSSVFFSILAIP